MAVPSSGYRWWYLDGISDNGRNGVVVIAFIGSVFSPYYFRARQRGPADPLDYCAVNVGLYRARGKRWAMTERDGRSVARSPDTFRVGRSQLEWNAGRLEVLVNERSAPFGQRLEGRIVVEPAVSNARDFALDPGGRHRWSPLAPCGRLTVHMDAPNVEWRGDAYIDTNWGTRALEDDFSGWHWSRQSSPEAATIAYAATLRDGRSRSLALGVDRERGITETTLAPAVRLPVTGWRIGRTAFSEAPLRVVSTLEDTPFYARSLVAAEGGNARSVSMHESLSLERFRSTWVRGLLPFRMPRRTTPVNSPPG